VLGAAQTGICYGIFLVLYRTVPVGRGRRADEEPHPQAAQSGAARESRVAGGLAAMSALAA